MIDGEEEGELGGGIEEVGDLRSEDVVEIRERWKLGDDECWPPKSRSGPQEPGD